jgi:hypothetical protein
MSSFGGGCGASRGALAAPTRVLRGCRVVPSPRLDRWPLWRRSFGRTRVFARSPRFWRKGRYSRSSGRTAGCPRTSASPRPRGGTDKSRESLVDAQLARRAWPSAHPKVLFARKGVLIRGPRRSGRCSSGGKRHPHPPRDDLRSKCLARAEAVRRGGCSEVGEDCPATRGDRPWFDNTVPLRWHIQEVWKFETFARYGRKSLWSAAKRA